MLADAPVPIGSLMAIERSQGWHRRLTVPQFTVVTGLLVVLIGTLLLATPLWLLKPRGALGSSVGPHQPSP